VNRPWLNAVAGVIVSAMLVLSMILVISTVIPSIDVTQLLVVLGSIAAVILVAGGTWMWIRSRGVPKVPELSREERESWRMPALALLERPASSLARRVALYALGSYVVVAIVMLAVKAIQLATQR
jgi:hypothetical protein